MTLIQFRALLLRTRMRDGDRTTEACKLVLCSGLTAYAACKKVGVSQSAVSKALARLHRLSPAP